MKQNKYSIRPAIIEALIILTTSMLTLLLREVLGMMTYIIPITLLVVFILLKREFEIKLENRQLPVIEQLDINGGLLFKKAVCCDS